jgi:CheY-like chemotaxis protein
MPKEQERVLLVEDDDANAEAALEWLAQAGYRIERAQAYEDAIAKAVTFRPHVIILDLQIPSQPGRADEKIEHGLRTLDVLVSEDPFRPVVIASAHGRNSELVRQVMQRNRGGHFIFKDDKDLRAAFIKAVAVALQSPAYVASLKVTEFEALISKNPREEEIRLFLSEHWRILLGPEYIACHSPYEIERGTKVDLLFERPDSFVDLWELKRPDQMVFQAYNERLHQSTECARAVGQLIEYIDLAEKQTGGALSLETRRGLRFALHRPRGVVVIGRRKDERERDLLALHNSFFAGISIRTYDDLLERARGVLTFLRDYRNGSFDPRSPAA